MFTARPSRPRISVVVPTKNEAKNLREVLPTLPDVHEVILVDGHSVDGTIEAAREVMPDIRVVRQTRRGKGNALASGFNAATGDIIVMFDADGSADAGEIHRFVDALLAGADFAKGSRFTPGGGSHDITRLRSVGNHGLNLVANLLFGTRFTDLCYGYNAFWRDLVADLELPSPEARVGADVMLWGDGFEIETVLNCRMARNQVQITEVPSIEKLRIHGVSNLNAVTDGLRVLRTLLAERFRKSRRQHRLMSSSVMTGEASRVEAA
ncbi:MAG: glycosyltransferase family 2 protein [Propionibacteriales bacterium]|nr:glycosyltransferase family 2 protein [Propionibacteriales bacterium]